MFHQKVCIGWVFIACALFSRLFDVYAQRQQVTYQTDLFFAGATEDVLPFWSTANQFGILDATSPNGIVRFKAVYPGVSSDGKWGYDLGIDFVGRTGDRSAAFFQQFYGRLRRGIFELNAGRKERSTGKFTLHCLLVQCC